MEYGWDKTKNRSNIAKHGVDFADAVAVFEDGLALTRPDPDAQGEKRFITLGLDAFGRHLVVVFTERESIIRIVLARARDQAGAKSI